MNRYEQTANEGHENMDEQLRAIIERLEKDMADLKKTMDGIQLTLSRRDTAQRFLANQFPRRNGAFLQPMMVENDDHGTEGAES